MFLDRAQVHIICQTNVLTVRQAAFQNSSLITGSLVVRLTAPSNFLFAWINPIFELFMRSRMSLQILIDVWIEAIHFRQVCFAATQDQFVSNHSQADVSERDWFDWFTAHECWNPSKMTTCYYLRYVTVFMDFMRYLRYAFVLIKIFQNVKKNKPSNFNRCHGYNSVLFLYFRAR